MKITSVLLIDSGLVQVRWESVHDECGGSGAVLLMGAAFDVGAISVRRPS